MRKMLQNVIERTLQKKFKFFKILLPDSSCTQNLCPHDIDLEPHRDLSFAPIFTPLGQLQGIYFQKNARLDLKNCH